ncbi:glycoside hydrolase family 6 protein [Angustibacter sp. McL0619]|uniref:glycoside hydrolase family 6 protein n=1 Tax=Angustibacter sp. McL0619 TaxID=3415676 RepID=UPI003CEDA7CA
MSRTAFRAAVVLTAAICVLALSAPDAAGAARPSSGTGPAVSRFYTPPPPPGSLAQIWALAHSGRLRDAALVLREVTTPQAVWFTKGTPAQVRGEVRRTVRAARLQRAVATLVAYDLPYRDCGQYSAGGAAGTSAYAAWIDAFAAGIGDQRAVVVLEPDGLGLIPNYVSALDGSSNCTLASPPGVPADGAPTPENRFTQLNHAVDALTAHPNVSVYLDATHTAWQNVGESADRLVKAGVQRAAGFFVNASNYQFTPNLAQYGDWVSKCLAYATTINPGDYNGCPNQYWNGGPSNGWTGVALNNYGIWSDTATTADLNTLGVNERYDSMLGATVPTAHFVVDTSRNGQGPWKPPSGAYPDAQDWCNPPGRGLGERPTANTGDLLMDAKLWIKTPGQSDGQCNRGVAGATTDPEWGGITDPAAGAWFPQQALQLAQLSSR